MAVNLNKTPHLKTTDGKKAIPDPTLQEMGAAGLKRAKAFAGKHKAALIAAGVGGAVGAGGTYLASRSRKSGDE